MELLLSFIEGVGLTASLMSLVWIWRHGRLRSVFGAAGVVILAFMLWQFISIHVVHGHGISLLHQIDAAIVGIFAILATALNTHLASRKQTQINIGIDRRVSNTPHYFFNGNNDRRQKPTQSLHS